MNKLAYILLCCLLLTLLFPSVPLLAQTEGGVSRSINDSSPYPGQTVTVTIQPSGVKSFYAVKEGIDGLQYTGRHTADSNPEGTTFTNLSPDSFTYEVRIPDSAKEGDKFVITGQFWTDPADKRDIGATTLRVSRNGSSGTGKSSTGGSSTGDSGDGGSALVGLIIMALIGLGIFFFIRYLVRLFRKKKVSPPSKKETVRPSKKKVSPPSKKETVRPSRKKASPPSKKETGRPSRKKASPPSKKETGRPSRKKPSAR